MHTVWFSDFITKVSDLWYLVYETEILCKFGNGNKTVGQFCLIYGNFASKINTLKLNFID